MFDLFSTIARAMLLLLVSAMGTVLAAYPDDVAVTDKQPAVKVDRVKARIFTLEADIRRLESKLTEMQSGASRLSDEINQLELRRAVLSGKIEKYELELDQAEERIASAETGQKNLEAQAAQLQDVLGRRVRQLYKRGNLGYAQLLLNQSRLSELITAYHYAKVLTAKDHQLLNQFRETHRALEQVKVGLETSRAEAETAKQGVAERERELANLLQARNRRLRGINKEAAVQRQLMEDLALEHEELQLLVRRLTDSDADPWELRIPIRRYKGKLDWPATGRLRRRFGIFRDPEFRTERRQNGIDIAIVKGNPVRAVYSGKVIYADWFKNYGNLVILDHQDKITTFYAHCDRILVKKGEFVEKEQILALGGDTGSLEGPMLHFEIRDKTKAQDPLVWLKKRGGASAGR